MVEGTKPIGVDRSVVQPTPTGPVDGSVATVTTRAPTTLNNAGSVTTKDQLDPTVTSTRPPGTPVATNAVTALAPEATGTQTAAPAGEGTTKKVFGFLDKILKNPIFQGLFAVLAAIPGIGQVVSGVAAVLSLVNIIEQWVSTGKPPDMMGIASTLLYLGGVFVPGLGAFGGLLGMYRTPTQSEDQPPAKQPTTGATAPEQTAPTAAMADADYAKALEVVEAGLAHPTEGASTQEFENAILALRQEQVRLAKLPDNNDPRLQRLNTLFASEEIKHLPRERLEKLGLVAVVPQPMDEAKGGDSPLPVPAPAG